MNPFESGVYAQPRSGAEKQKPRSEDQQPKQEDGPLGIDVEKAKDVSRVLGGAVGAFDALVGGLERYGKKGEKSWGETAAILLGVAREAWPHLKEGAEALDRLLEEQQASKQNPEAKRGEKMAA